MDCPNSNKSLELSFPQLPSTNFTHSLHLPNSSISPANSAALNEFLGQINHNLSSLDSTLLQLANLTSQAQRLRVDHLNLRDKYRPLLSSIRRLPNEILSLVFEHANEGQANAPVSSLPMLFTHVNRAWRTIAVHTPSLWSQVSFGISGIECSDANLILVQMWMTRSGVSPLTLDIEMDPMAALHSWRNKSLLSMLFTQIHRWKNIRFCLPVKFYFSPIFEPVQSAPLVERLWLETVEKNAVRQEGLPFRWNCTMPAIRRVMFGGSMGRLIDNTSLQWGSPTHVKLREFNVNDAIQILQLTPSLQSLTISRPFGLVAQASVILPNLETLRICNSQSSDFLVAITAPALKALEFGAQVGEPHNVAAFLVRSPFISELVMETNGNPAFLSCIRHRTDLETITLKVKEDVRAPLILSFLREMLLRDPPSHIPDSSGAIAIRSFAKLKTLRIKVSISASNKIEYVTQLRDVVQSLANNIGQSTSCPQLEKIVLKVRSAHGNENTVGAQIFLLLKEMYIPGLIVSYEL